MFIPETEKKPKADESLGHYVKRLRTTLRLSQKETALKAGIHHQSYGKLERDKTSRLTRKTLNGLAHAFQIPHDFLDAACRGTTANVQETIKFCPVCWVHGSTLEEAWLLARAQFCFECGHAWQSKCMTCDAPITSLKHCFCPFCGASYKAQSIQGAFAVASNKKQRSPSNVTD